MNIDTELARLRAERERLDTVISYLEQQRNGPRPRRRPPGTLTAAQAALAALTEAGQPMKTGDLLRAVQARGARMSNAEGLAKTLGRSGKFKRVGRGIWTLTE